MEVYPHPNTPIQVWIKFTQRVFLTPLTTKVKRVRYIYHTIYHIKVYLYVPLALPNCMQ